MDRKKWALQTVLPVLLLGTILGLSRAFGEPPPDEAPPAAAPEAAEQPALQPAPPAQVLRKRARRFAPRGQAVPAQVQIQFGANGLVEVEDDAADALFVQPERERLQLLTRAKKLLQEQRYGEAARNLGSILEGNEDGVLPQPTGEPIRFLKAEALRVLSDPKDPAAAQARDSYQRQFEPQARHLLSSALAAGGTAQLEEVSRRFPLTPAGYEATYLLASHHLDHGRPLAAALCFQRLADLPEAAAGFEPELSFKLSVCWHWAGASEKARAALLNLKQRYPRATLQIAGQPAELFANDGEALTWLARTAGTPQHRAAESDQWTMFRGDSQRNASSLGSRPLLNYRWRVPITNDPFVMELVGQMREAYMDQNITAIPGLHPLAIGNVVLMRTTHNLLAIDFRSGKRIWEVPTDDAWDRMLDSRGGSAQARVAAQVTMGLDQRLWEDAVYGTLSSDGDYVYTVEDLSLNANPTEQRMLVMINGRRRIDPNWPKNYNRLAAHELRTEGKLKWALGGSPGEGELPEAGSFFLGPPLPLAGRLYTLAEAKGEIRLLAIHPKKNPFGGESLVEWTQPLVMVEQNILQNNLRRMAGISPSYADGMLVCPTAAGAVAAVDLTTRSLKWGYSYAASPQLYDNRLAILRMGMMPDQSGATTDHWIDGSVTIAAGRVLLTPVESNEIHCLNLIDGQPLWKKPRADGLYLACVAEDKALVVGRTKVRALRLTDGQPVWAGDGLTLPSGSVPSGRGFFNGGRYYLPLSTGEVAAIDVDTGKIVDRARSRSGRVPGNLICYRGAVISQGVDYVDCFYQASELERQVAEKLAEHPDDPAALALQGEILLDQGKLSDAISVLRRSLEQSPSPRARELLVDSLLEGLRSDFAAFRDSAEEIQRLAEQSQQRDVFLRLMATGLQESGDTLGAFKAYLELANLKLDAEALQRVDAVLSVRRDRWVQARLAGLREKAQPEELTQMDEAIQARYAAALEAGTPDALRQFVSYFGNQPQADLARQQLAAIPNSEGALLESELLLRRVAESAQPELARAATVRLAALLNTTGRPEQAVQYYRRLAGEWADIVCLDGKTGRQLLDELPAEGPLRAELAGQDRWPTGLVETKKQAKVHNGYRSFAFDLIDSRESLARETAVEWDQQRQAIIGRDGLGRLRWQLTLSDPAQQMNRYGFNPSFNRARLHGNLLLVSLGHQVFAIDTLSDSSRSSARVLWKQDLSGTIPGVVGVNNFGIHHMQINVPWGGPPRFFTADAWGRPLGMIGPLSGDYVCLQRGRNLMALDPLTGETLWTRQSINPSSEVFGDEQFVLVAAPETNEALVLHAMDGRELGRCPVPPSTERITSVGRRLLVWSTPNGRPVVRLIDPWKQRDQDVWRHPCAPGARASLVGTDALGVMEPDGHFVILNIANGKRVVDAELEKEPNLNEIQLLSSQDRFILVASNPIQGTQQVAGVQPIPGGLNNPTVNGHVYGFDRASGKQIWKAQVENQGLFLDQPSELPVLVFACQIYKRLNNQSNTTLASILCLDKRTGRVIVQDESANPMSNFELVADPEKQTIDLKMLQHTISMTFTDQPLPETPPAEQSAAEQSVAEPPSLPVEAADVLGRGLRRWFFDRLPKIDLPQDMPEQEEQEAAEEIAEEPLDLEGADDD